MRESDIFGEITDIETIAQGSGVKIRRHLENQYGRGRWRKRKGIAMVKDNRGSVRMAEIHWYEAHGIGRRDFKRKRWLED